MRERPIQDLVDGLVQLGVDAQCTMGTGCPPVTVNAAGLPSGKVGGTIVCDICILIDKQCCAGDALVYWRGTGACRGGDKRSH
jgi:hypothetical protein